MKNMRQKLIAALTAAVACFLWIPTAAADIIHADDVIIQRSACIGFDCVNGEGFGFDTIRLKENNLRIKALDTSAGSFPTNDWEITFNESNNGGLSKFSITDITGAKVPFTIEAGTPSNSLYVDSTHKVGFGTSTPVLDLHVSTGNSPGLRLEQNTASGFTAQTWDVAGNEANFFVRDATNGSTLPFRIRPGAPTSSVDISETGNVGIGTASPDAELDVENNGPPRIFLTNTMAGSDQWGMRVDNSGRYVVGTAGDTDHLIISNSGDLTLTGQCADEGQALPIAGDGCDAVFDPSYEIESIEEHASLMWENSYLPAIGPTPEGKRISLNMQQRHFGVLNELEKAHIYIERLNEKLKDKASQVDDLTERLARLEALVGANTRNND